MQRALVTLVLLGVVASCRMNFDPVDEAGEDPEAIGSTQGASSITAEPGSEFVTTCVPGAPCMVDCTEATSCIVSCDGASTCDVMCAPAGCIVNDCTAPSCEVDCGLGDKTIINNTHFCSMDR